MIDLHLHLLPGIDDGPQDDESSLRLARALLADRVSAVAVTPHVSDRYANTAAGIAERTAAFAELLAAEGLELPVATGAEIAIDRLPLLSDDELVALSLAGHGRHLLLEVPYAAWPMDIELHVARVESLGMAVVLAHPERCAAVQSDDAPLRRLVDRGVLAQVTAGSLSGAGGRGARRTASKLIAAGAVQMIGSDAHGADRRPPRMTEARKAVGDPVLAEWLTVDVPRAIIEGRQPPASPATSRRSGWRSVFRRSDR